MGALTKTSILLLAVFAALLITQLFQTNPPKVTGDSATGVIKIIIYSVVPSFQPPLQNQTVHVGNTLIYFVSAVDANSPTLNFSDNATFFDIIKIADKTALINFTATQDLLGSHPVNITVTDDVYNTSEVIWFTILPAPPPPTPGMRGGGRGKKILPDVEMIVWKCTPWGPCMPDKTQMRICYCINFAHCKEIQKPLEKRPCIPPSCEDGIQNGLEADVDCGGDCPKCEDGKKCYGDADCINKCNPKTMLCYTPTKPPEKETTIEKPEPEHAIEPEPIIEIPLTPQHNLFGRVKKFVARYPAHASFIMLLFIAIILILILRSFTKRQLRMKALSRRK